MSRQVTGAKFIEWQYTYTLELAQVSPQIGLLSSSVVDPDPHMKKLEKMEAKGVRFKTYW